MEFYIADQTLVFLYACVLGAALSIVYDIFRLIRITAVMGRAVIAVEDIIFFIIVSFSTFVFILSFTEGVIRFYVIFGELLGFILCHVTLGALIVKLLGGFIRLLKRIFLRIFKAVGGFFKKRFAFVCRLISKVYFKHKKSCKNRKKYLQNNKQIRYNQFIRGIRLRGRCKNGGKNKKAKKTKA